MGSALSYACIEYISARTTCTKPVADLGYLETYFKTLDIEPTTYGYPYEYCTNTSPSRAGEGRIQADFKNSAPAWLASSEHAPGWGRAGAGIASG